MVVRVAVAGVGNCTSVLLQGLRYYRNRAEGLWHPKIGGMGVRDVRVVAALEVDSNKVGIDLSEAINTAPNVAKRVVEIPRSGIVVLPGLADGEVPPHLRGVELKTTSKTAVARALKEAEADILLNMISSGSDKSSRAYAEACIDAGCSYANCTPSLVLSDGSLVSRFRAKKLVIVGDDLMSQLGSTLFHRGILKMLVERGLKMRKSYQLDVGGGAETFNTIDEKIRAAKRKVKTSSVMSEVPYKFETVTGTTDYVDYLGNDRTSYFWLEASGFLGSPLTLDVYLRSSDGANAGNLLLDVVRAVKASVKSRRFGVEQEVCAYAFKSPPRAVHYDDAYNAFKGRFVH